MKKYKYPEPDNNQIFELDYISEKGTAYFKCGHAVTNLVFDDLIDLETGYAKWELINNTYHMNKLNKPKAFEASPKSIMVQFGPEEREVTNLTRSAIMVQTVVLVANENKWHEIEIADLGIDSVHLPSFKNHIETNGLTLSDLGIAPEIPDYSLKHDDFADLEKEFPKHNYIDISKLNDYEKLQGGYSGKFTLRMTLRAIDQQYLSIDGWISAAQERKDSMLKSSNTTLLDSLEEVRYEDVVNADSSQQTIIVETVPVSGSVPSDSISISIFENLTPAKVTELHALRIEQEKIAEENPIVVITDKKTYTEAKKVKAILLSASTRIDGKTGVFANAKKYLNNFKSKLDQEGVLIAAITRAPHDKQNKLIEDWDNRLLLQTQNRIKQLFEVPFIFNGVDYTIGSFLVTQKAIEELPDEEFTGVIEKGKSIQIALEAVRTEQDTKITAQEKEIAELKAMLQRLLPKKEVVDNVVFETTVIENPESGATEAYKAEFVQESNPFEPVSTQSIIDRQNSFRAERSSNNNIELPNPNNKLLNQLYLDHVSVVEEKQFQECAGYYAQALQDASEAINDILINPDKTIQKSVAITELIKTWKL